MQLSIFDLRFVFTLIYSRICTLQQCSISAQDLLNILCWCGDDPVASRTQLTQLHRLRCQTTDRVRSEELTVLSDVLVSLIPYYHHWREICGLSPQGILLLVAITDINTTVSGLFVYGEDSAAVRMAQRHYQTYIPGGNSDSYQPH